MPKVDLGQYLPDSPILEGEFQEEDISRALAPMRAESDPWLIKQLLKETIETFGDLILALYKLVPQTDTDLPLFIYRVDIIPFDRVRDILLREEESLGARGRELEELFGPAIVQLKYDEGFPTMPSGNPIWEKFDFETNEAYSQFATYISDGPTRALYKLISYDPLEVIENSKRYYWTTRIRAFDVYRVAYHEKIRLHRALEAEDSHYLMADRMLKKLNLVFDETTVQDLKDLGVDKAVAVAEKLVKIQRDSVGLNNPKAYEDRLTAPTMHKLVRKVTRSEAVERQETDETEHITNDLEALEMAQELIIKVQSSKDIADGTARSPRDDDVQP